MTIYRLNHTLRFPLVHLAAEDGLLAVGGDLSAERLLTAYSQGIFPWPHDDLPLLWFAPEQRMALKPGEVHVSRSLRATLREEKLEVRFDTDFDGVIRGCATSLREGQDGTWIDSAMVAAYTRLHELGYAHSVETWLDGDLVGGLYGVSLGGVFFGESMFSRESDASKVAFCDSCSSAGSNGLSAHRLPDAHGPPGEPGGHAEVSTDLHAGAVRRAQLLHDVREMGGGRGGSRGACPAARYGGI